MKKTFYSDFNKILHRENKKINTEEIFIDLVTEFYFKKYDLDKDTYYKLMENGLIEYREFNKKYLNDDIEKTIVNLEPFFLCSILEEYMNRKNREITGSFYTPKYIIDFMVDDALKTYLTENLNIDNSLADKLIKESIDYDTSCVQLKSVLNALSNIKIIDISCGTGLFLLSVIDKLYSIIIKIYKNLQMNFDSFQVKKNIIENNIYGIDIQSIPLQMFTLACIDILGKCNRFNLSDLQMNIYQKNSIMGDEILQLNKIKEVIEDGGFDMVIGNPPYIGEKGNKDKFRKIRNFNFGKKYYEGKMDYFYYFIYRGIELLRENGILTYITTNYFITADGASKLRKYLKDNVSFKTVTNFNECEIFESAKGLHNLIFTVVKGNFDHKEIQINYFNGNNFTSNEIKDLLSGRNNNTSNFSAYKIKNQSKLYGANGNLVILSNEKYFNIVERIKNKSDYLLGDLCNINQGIVSGADKVTERMMHTKLMKYEKDKFNIEIGEGIFVLDREEIINSKLKECKLLKPFFKNSDIKKYFTKNNPEKYILYITDDNISYEEWCVALNEHLIKFKNVLKLRREAAKGVRKWYALQWSRDEKIFQKPKIVVPHRALLNNFGYSECSWYASADVYFITGKDTSFDIKLLLAILNSKITYFWLYNMGKRKGNFLELYSKPLSQIPVIVNFNPFLKKNCLNIVNNILKICNDKYDHKLIEEMQQKIDNELYKLYGFSEDEVKVIENLYKQNL